MHPALCQASDHLLTVSVRIGQEIMDWSTTVYNAPHTQIHLSPELECLDVCS